MLKKVKALKRRGVETIFQKMGVSDGTHDPEYEDMKKRHDRTVRELHEMTQGMATYLERQRDFFGAGAELADVTYEFYFGRQGDLSIPVEMSVVDEGRNFAFILKLAPPASIFRLMGDWPAGTPSALRSHQGAAAFKAAWAHCNDAVRRSVTKTWLDQSLGPLRAHVAAIVPEVQKEHEVRQAYVKDFDSYRRRYHALQDKHAKAAAADPASAKAAELERALYGIQSKLTAAEDRYRRQNAKVKEAMLGAKLARDELLETAVLTVLTLQMELFRQTSERLGDLAQFLPEERAAPLRDAVRALVAKGGPEVRVQEASGMEKMFKTMTGAFGATGTGTGASNTSPRLPATASGSGSPQQQQHHHQHHALAGATMTGPLPPTPSGVNTTVNLSGPSSAPLQPQQQPPPAKSPTKPSSVGLGSTFSNFFSRSSSRGGEAQQDGKAGAGAGEPASGYERMGSEGGAAGTDGAAAVTPPPPTAAIGSAHAHREPIFYARALYDNEPEDETELGFAVGDVLEILGQDDSGWWEARLNGRIGSVPANYLEVVPKP